jgi:3-deoxy-D-manno-octulosonic acid kinase
MIRDGGQRIATSDGAMLADPTRLGNRPLAGAMVQLFDTGFWERRGELADVPRGRGRGSAWFVGSPPHQWALRHYRRGGFIARLSADRYIWAGEARVRAFAEWRLLAALAQLELPVPLPVAARYQRSGWFYRCDLITQRIADAEPLSSLLARGALQEEAWRGIGATLARFHAAGVDHADLNAHNILLDGGGAVSVIDFDRGRLRPAGAWAAANLARLEHSLAKVSRDLPADRFSSASWDALLAGYASRSDHASPL